MKRKYEIVALGLLKVKYYNALSEHRYNYPLLSERATLMPYDIALHIVPRLQAKYPLLEFRIVMEGDPYFEKVDKNGYIIRIKEERHKRALKRMYGIEE